MDVEGCGHEFRAVREFFSYLYDELGFWEAVARRDEDGTCELVLESRQCRIRFGFYRAEIDMWIGTHKAPMCGVQFDSRVSPIDDPNIWWRWDSHVKPFLEWERYTVELTSEMLLPRQHRPSSSSPDYIYDRIYELSRSFFPWRQNVTAMFSAGALEPWQRDYQQYHAQWLRDYHQLAPKKHRMMHVVINRRLWAEGERPTGKWGQLGYSGAMRTRGEGSSVVLGRWKPSGGYVGEAIGRVAAYFEMGESAADSSRDCRDSVFDGICSFLSYHLMRGVDTFQVVGVDAVLFHASRDKCDTKLWMDLDYMFENAEFYGYEFVPAENAWVKVT